MEKDEKDFVVAEKKLNNREHEIESSYEEEESYYKMCQHNITLNRAAYTEFRTV